MPVEVPKDEKVYTKIYQLDKGVDFTNDASNVFKRRSPSGKNMLPNLDGRPYKRCGWEVKCPADSFKPTYTETKIGDGSWYKWTLSHGFGMTDIKSLKVDGEEVDFSVVIPWPSEFPYTQIKLKERPADGAVVKCVYVEYSVLTPDRLHYFELGGSWYVMVFNSLGVFYIKDSGEPVKCQLASGTTPTLSEFPPEIVVDNTTQKLPADSGRSFFFEGNGIAGFYTFCGRNLYRFDGEYYWEMSPYVPTVLDGCTPATGAGTDGEPKNILTDFRKMTYFGDGTAEYAIIGGANPDSVSVKVLNQATGIWETQAENTDYTVDSQTGNVTFLTGHIPGNSTVANVEITSIASDNGYCAVTQDVETETKPMSVKSVYTERQTKTRTKTERRNLHTNTSTTTYSSVTEGSWVSNGTTTSYSGDVTLSLPRNYSRAETHVKTNRSGSWADVSADDFSTSFNAYNDSVVVGLKNMSTTGGTVSTVTGGWSSWSSRRTGIKQINSSTVDYIYTETSTRTRTTTTTKAFSIKGQYDRYDFVGSEQEETKDTNAFFACQKCLNYGNNISSQMFIASTPEKNCSSRMWYSAVNDPSYFPDVNYVEVGADDTQILGLLKVGSYLGVVKTGSGMDASVYLAYPTSFDDMTSYAVKAAVNGVGAVSRGAFNILNGEPLFLSELGVVGIEMNEDETEHMAQNRSYFLNGKLCAEPNLKDAVSFEHNKMYYLAVNNHCYVLDGSQKNSWGNDKTNLQYEGYFLDNVPAQCFARMGEELWFMDFEGNICRFKTKEDQNPYRDEYSVYKQNWNAQGPPTIENDEIIFQKSDLRYSGGLLGVTPKASDTILYAGIRAGEVWYTVVDVFDDTVKVETGVPVEAEWSTIADDDGAVHFFKNMQKKGCLVSLLPDSNSGVEVFIKQDEKDAVKIGEADASGHILPSEYYMKKKVKKYKRLQIICRNKGLDDGFGINQIIKSYTIGNYSKNKGAANET